MKQFLTFILLICGYVLCGAQATSLTVDNQTPGWLSSKINYGDQQTVESLTITGYLNATDLTFIGSLMQKQKLHQALDLSETYIVGDSSHDDNEVSYDNIFGLKEAVNINLLSMPKSIITPTPPFNGIPFRYLSVDTLIYGSEICQIYNNALWGHTLSNGGGALSSPKHLILREGITAIADYACNTSKTIETVECPGTIRAIGKGAFLECKQLHSINLPNTIETIDFEAFRETQLLPDTLFLPTSLKMYYTTAFPRKNGQVVIIPETVTEIDNTYRTYNNSTNIWTTWDYITSDYGYHWVMKSATPPYVAFHYAGFLKGSTIIIPKNSYSSYSVKAPFSYAKLIETKVVETITVNPKVALLDVGQSRNLTVSIQPKDADDKSITWSSADSSIASVSESGILSAVSPGVARICASSNYNPEIKDFCEVTVIQPVTGLNLDRNEQEMVEDESTRIQATVLPDNASNKKVTWTSSDISIAMVSGDGTVYAIKAGQATIMATSEDGGFVALCKVTVKPKTILAESISFNTSASKLAVGESLQLTASISPENATIKTLKWSSTNTSVATVDASGLVSVIAQGTTRIIATTTDGSNLSAICDITVEKQFVYVSDLQITPTSERMAIGETIPLNVIIKPSDATNKTIVWSSTNPGVASVSKEGLVTAVSEGEAIIIASSQDGSNLSSTCNVTVYNNVILVSSISLDKEVVNGYPNETIQLTASVLPENASNKTLVWNSTNPSVADIDNNGLLILLQKGSANITAASTDGSKIKAHCAVFVSDMSSIDSVISDKNESVKIYNSAGILVFDGIYSEANLTPGIYIILYNGERFKAKL